MTLKVVHVITHLALGGATETVLTTCRLADPARFEMSVLSGETSEDEATLEVSARQEGTALHHLPSLKRAIRPPADGRAYRDLVAWLRRVRPDIVHTHGSKAGFLARIAARAAGVPVIVHTVHGWGHHERQHPLVRRAYVALERRAARGTDCLVAVAAANRDKGLADGIGRFAQYEIIHSCINIAAFRDVAVDVPTLRASLGIPADALLVGTIGRLAPQKAPQDFVRMAALVHAQRPRTHFVWVGGGPLEFAMRGWIAEAGLGSVVHLLGYRDDVPQLLRVLDVFVLTSLWEGLPRVFAQAMCAALPIVATLVDGAPEAITHGENGFLVAPQDMEAMAAHVVSLLDDPALRHALGQRGRSMADPKFSERHMVHQIEALYLRLAHEKGLLAPGPLSSAPPPNYSASPPTVTL